jgi:hypothetical protein
MMIAEILKLLIGRAVTARMDGANASIQMSGELATDAVSHQFVIGAAAAFCSFSEGSVDEIRITAHAVTIHLKVQPVL